MAVVAAEGKRRRDKELSLHESEHRDFVLGSQRTLIELVLPGQTATIDDLRAVITIPSSVSTMVLGSIPGPLVRAGVIRRVGYRESSRACAHARPVSVWALADAGVARQWLIDHPAPVSPVAPVVQRTLFGGEG